MPKKQTTIEDLAVMVKYGFEGVDKRFDGIDNRLDGIDNRLDGIDNRLDGIDNRLVNVESDVSYLKSRVEEIGRSLNHHEEILEEHSEELKWLHKKIDEITNSHGDKRLITYKEFLALNSRVTTLEKKVAARIK